MDSFRDTHRCVACVTNHIESHISIASDGAASGDVRQSASTLARGITVAIQRELIAQHRDGGIFSSTPGR